VFHTLVPHLQCHCTVVSFFFFSFLELTPKGVDFPFCVSVRSITVVVGVAGGGECVTRLGDMGKSAEGAPLDQGCQPESTKVSQGKSCMLIAIIIHRCSS